MAHQHYLGYTEEEVEAALKVMKNERAAGLLGVKSNLLHAAGRVGLRESMNIVNEVFHIERLNRRLDKQCYHTYLWEG